MKIAFLLFSDKLSSYKFCIGETNPGIGGTQFTTIQLALRLAELYNNWEISLVNTTSIQIDKKNINIILSSNVNEFLITEQATQMNVVVATIQSMRGIDLELLKKISNRIVAWSHHPYDDRLRYLDGLVPFGAVVSVGAYQFYSNKWLRSPSFFIQNIFMPLVLSADELRCHLDKDQPVLVHLGALVSGKGFLYIAQQWPKIKEKFPGAKFHIIGGSDLYRNTEQHDLIPVTPALARSILEYITRDDLEQGSVKFHGNLGAEKFDILKQAHVALQNPTGATEAFPASTLECMSVGLPVIASADFGMWDSMRFFSELQLQKPSQIVEKLHWLLEDERRYIATSERAKSVAIDFSRNTDDILTRWTLLLKAVSAGNAESLELETPMPKPKSAWHFSQRIIREHGRLMLSLTPIGSVWRKLKAALARKQ